ncbi:inositol monophosphatase family protein [Sulfitobacter sp. MF3-043]|uniref:inositol monophosphatase family protein n=1 Tax=Sulfitobacter sediminivivens TaxID=3252902 RepID=UPI0036DA421C
MNNRAQQAVEIATDAGDYALDFFKRVGSLKIEDKGHQDFVSEADKAVELLVRKGIEAAFPEDGIVGEEHAPKPSVSGYTWVIDPIDGTTNFINNIPAWTVVIAIVKDDKTIVGVTRDPIHNETYLAERGKGAFLNGTPLVCPPGADLTRGTVGTGFSNRTSPDGVRRLINEVLDAEGVFHRNASGALSLAYVAAGRLLGYVEEHMNAWDCLAGQLLIAEAGGQIELQSADEMIVKGGRVVAGSKGVFDELVRIADAAYKP